MDIHRCRFVPYQPSAINVLAFSHDFQRKGRSVNVRLAIGRANGDIEIWNPLNGAWLQEIIIKGGKDRSIDGLVWTQDPDEEVNGRVVKGQSRLFSIGYTTTVTEWNLLTGEPLRHTSGNHGEIWCMAAQPALTSKQGETAADWPGQKLVTGCTDGGVVLYSTEDEDLKFQRVLSKSSAKKAKIISIVFQTRNLVVAGCTDSTIRLFDIQKGTNIRNMSLGSGPSGGPKEIIVWAVKCLPNGNIVSGDSTGELRIWDGKTHTLMQRIKSHTQDMLSLATSHDGTTMFSGGMDRRTVVYKLAGNGRARWVKTSHKRYHAHDVKTMATFEDNSVSVVASGGVDTTPIITPLREFGLEHQRKLQFLPQNPIILSAPAKRLIMSYWDREVCIWQISKASTIDPDADESDSESDDQNRKLVARIIIKGEASITSASITADGTLLAISTAIEIKLFHLRAQTSINSNALKVSKIATPSSFDSSGARMVEFSPDGKWLCLIRSDARVSMARIQCLEASLSGRPKVLKILAKLERLQRKKEKMTTCLGGYDRTITRTAFSSDSRILAVSDLAGFIDTWVLEGVEDQTQELVDVSSDAGFDTSSDDEADDASKDGDDESEKGTVICGQRWIRNPSAALIPRMPSSPIVLSFRPPQQSTATAKVSKTGSSIPHSTRSTANPVSPTLTSQQTEDRLLIVTAKSQIYEIEVLKGGLSSWSRRNPTERFSTTFRGIRDLAMGVVWDMTGENQRMWLYGVSWLWMFDLSRDLPSDATSGQTKNEVLVREENGRMAPNDKNAPQQKRKRGLDDSEQDAPRAKTPKKGASGAGDRIPDAELELGIGRKIVNIKYDEDNEGNPAERVEVRDIRRAAHVPSPDADGKDEGASDEDESDDEGGDIAMGGIHDDDAADENVSARRPEERRAARDGQAGCCWSTFKYRPIMGIVPISSGPPGGGSGGGGGGGGVEVVLVERPLWDVELPPRFYGDQEWERAGFP